MYSMFLQMQLSTLSKAIDKIFLKKKILSKRQKFVAGVLFLSTGLFLTERFLGGSGLFLVILLAFISDGILYLALRADLKNNFSYQLFILPFIFTLSFGLFYLLFPERLLVILILTTIYAIGIYSVYLSHNIFIVSSIRTIALLSSARTVSFVATLISFFILIVIIFSLHLNIIFTLLLIGAASFSLIIQSIWNYSLDKDLKEGVIWGAFLTVCVLETSFLLWFWPSSATIVALFMTGFFYIILGLSHLWFEKRLFKAVLLEYIWVAFAVFIVLMVFTSWT